MDSFVLNTEDFGYLMKPSDHTHSSLKKQADSFINFKLKALGQLVGQCFDVVCVCVCVVSIKLNFMEP